MKPMLGSNGRPHTEVSTCGRPIRHDTERPITMNHLRLFLLAILAAAALGVAACGGSDEGGEATASTDVDSLLEQTFSGKKKVDSGKLDMKVTIDAQGGSSGLNGPVNITLRGPFEVQDAGRLPKFKLDASFSGAGQDIRAGATSTGEKGYVNFQNTDYVLSPQVFQQFKAGYEQAQKQNADAKQQNLASLGIDPRKWLTGAKNAGEAKVGDQDTIKITGGVDVPKLLDDINVALEKAASLGVGGAGQTPQKLTEDQKRQAVQAIKDPRVEIYTGKEDKILRRLVVTMGVQDASTTGKFAMDISLTGLNESQDIPEPSNAKPFDQLLGQLGGLGIGAGGTTQPADPSSGAGSQENLEQYSKCLTDAGSDVEQARKCADLLATG